MYRNIFFFHINLKKVLITPLILPALLTLFIITSPPSNYHPFSFLLFLSPLRHLLLRLLYLVRSILLPLPHPPFLPLPHPLPPFLPHPLPHPLPPFLPLPHPLPHPPFLPLLLLPLFLFFFRCLIFFLSLPTLSFLSLLFLFSLFPLRCHGV